MNPSRPIANLLVIRSPDIDRAAEFYRLLGMRFDRHAHGEGPEHYSFEHSGFVFEIYPLRSGQEPPAKVRFGFRVEDVDAVVDLLRQRNATIITPPTETQWGRRAVVRDLDGNTVELLSPPHPSRS